MVPLYSSKPVTRTQIGIVLVVGVVIGLIAGYVLMGTAHAVFEIGAEEHYQHGGPARRWVSWARIRKTLRMALDSLPAAHEHTGASAGCYDTASQPPSRACVQHAPHSCSARCNTRVGRGHPAAWVARRGAVIPAARRQLQHAGPLLSALKRSTPPLCNKPLHALSHRKSEGRRPPQAPLSLTARPAKSTPQCPQKACRLRCVPSPHTPPSCHSASAGGAAAAATLHGAVPAAHSCAVAGHPPSGPPCCPLCVHACASLDAARAADHPSPSDAWTPAPCAASLAVSAPVAPAPSMHSTRRWDSRLAPASTKPDAW